MPDTRVDTFHYVDPKNVLHAALCHAVLNLYTYNSYTFVIADVTCRECLELIVARTEKALAR